MGLAQFTPKEFFKPSSFKARMDDLVNKVLWADLAAGPLREVLRGDLVSMVESRGDQETRYLALWSPLRVVLTSGVQTKFIKVGSKSSVGAGVRGAHTIDQ